MNDKEKIIETTRGTASKIIEAAKESMGHNFSDPQEVFNWLDDHFDRDELLGLSFSFFLPHIEMAESFKP